jgi:transcriptional regulator with XRE-family HTH domain
VEYDAATVALRTLRLVAVASIFAFALTARTVAPARAGTGDPVTDPSVVVVDVAPTDPADTPPDPPPAPDPAPTEPPASDPTLPDPTPTEAPADGASSVDPAPVDPAPVDPAPTDPPPADPVVEEPPSADPVEPASTAAPPVETTPVIDTVPVDPPVVEEPPPVDVGEPTASEPPPLEPPSVDVPPGVDVLPIDPVVTEPPPATDDGNVGAEEPPASNPATELPPAEAVPPVADPAGAEAPVQDPAPASPSMPRPPSDVSPAAKDQAPVAVERAIALVSARSQFADEKSVPRTTEPLDAATVASAGLAAGLVVTNRAPGTVAVAVEFGRVGGGWASGIVFNLWLRRQLRERRMSQRQLAALSGVDHSTISRLLRQDRQPSLTTATKLVRALRRVRGEEAEPETAEYFERMPDESVFPARRVELALRADEQLNDDQIRRLMRLYLDARRVGEASASVRSAAARAGPEHAAGERHG